MADDFLQSTKYVDHAEVVACGSKNGDYPGTGKQFEVEEVIRCIEAGKCESDIHSHSDSLWMMNRMDLFRSEWGVLYPSTSNP
jgi:hypothetical protein